MKFVLLSLLIIALSLNGAISQTMSEEEVDLRVYKKIRDLDNQKFGKTIIDTIAVEMQSKGDAAQNLIKLLQDMEDSIRDEQDQDDDFIDNLQQECDSNLAKLKGDIEVAQERSAQLEAELEEKIPIRDQKVKTLADKNEFRQLIEQKIVEIDGRKDLKDQEWQEEQEQHNHATAVIERAKEVIQSSLKNFLQKGQNTFVQVAKNVRKNMKNVEFKRQSWNSFFNLLAQLSDDLQKQADQAAVERVLQLCDDILDKISESREIERRDYQHWIEEYNIVRDGLTAKLDKVNNKITELESQISALNTRIDQAKLEKQSQDQTAETKQQLHDEKLNYCDDENKAYFQRRQERDEQRAIVSDAIGLLTANLRTFRRYIKDRIQQEEAQGNVVTRG